jgi:hypothetical protein
MSNIINSDLAERNTRFEPDEIRAAIICETDFDFMKDEALCKEYATKIYDAQI